MQNCYTYDMSVNSKICNKIFKEIKKEKEDKGYNIQDAKGKVSFMENLNIISITEKEELNHRIDKLYN